jgi:outer membrane protein OmpA-like peptidoglycan-associated protein
MRIAPALMLFAALTASAAAQSTDSVTVNPVGGQVLIDPGTGQPRVLPPLLEPWQGEPVRLHPPRAHRARTTSAPETTATPPPVASISPPPMASEPSPVAAPPVVHKPKPAARVAVAPAPKPQAAPKPAPQQAARQPAPSITPDAIDSFITRSQTNVLSSASAAPRPSEPAPKPAKPATRTASIERANPTATAGKRRDVITFAAGATDPSTTAVAAVRSLAGSLNAALNDSGSRVQLLAYAGAKGEKSSDTRRLSLKRALVVRQLLIDDGVPSERIDVFALGGVEDSGPLDRVDVYVKS